MVHTWLPHGPGMASRHVALCVSVLFILKYCVPGDISQLLNINGPGFLMFLCKATFMAHSS